MKVKAHRCRLVDDAAVILDLVAEDQRDRNLLRRMYTVVKQENGQHAREVWTNGDVHFSELDLWLRAKVRP